MQDIVLAAGDALLIAADCEAAADLSYQGFFVSKAKPTGRALSEVHYVAPGRRRI